MTSGQQLRISGIRLRAASLALVMAAVVLIAAAILASHLAGASRASGAAQRSNAQRATPPPWTLTTLYSFTSGADGGLPEGGLIHDAAGNLYGTTTSGGGNYSDGVVFKVDTAGNETVLHSFNVVDGKFPNGSLIDDGAGNLYGTTFEGGQGYFCGNCGTVFKVDTAGNETVLYSFIGGADGKTPYGNVVRDASGNLYGTTPSGGDLNCPIGNGTGCGVVYKLDTTGNETVLYTFTGGADGSFPVSGLIHDAAGNLYGTTSYGGDLNCSISEVGCGVVFKLDTAGNETVLHAFTPGADGAEPGGGLIHDADGNLYGTTLYGGKGCYEGCGVVFKLDTNGTETVLYTFTGGADGGTPRGALILDAKGNIYGATVMGGDSACQHPNGCGVVFRIDPTGKESVLYAFTGEADGAGPTGGLIHDAAGNLYGVTTFGGDLGCSQQGLGCGTVFRLSPQ